MAQHKTVSINGVEYDPRSGMPLEMVTAVTRTDEPTSSTPRTASVHAHGVHSKAQRSSALNRQFVQKAAKKSAQRMDMAKRPAVSRSPHISKFAVGETSEVVAEPSSHDIGPVTHPAVHKAHTAAKPHHPAVKAQHQPRPAQEIKHAAISNALANAQPTKHENVKKTKKPGSRAFSVASASLGVLLLAGYFTYLNMPNLSVRVAAAQAGIDASYPEYSPIGYRLNGPVAYQDGEVSMLFASNSNTNGFALNQARSGWDSSALLSNYVAPQSKGEYATYSDAGLTIYTYGSNAAWVNGGILYTVEGSANLSNEQIRRIATSM